MLRFRSIYRLGLSVQASVLLVSCVAGVSSQQDSAMLARDEGKLLRVDLNEVVVTFNALDANGSPVNQLKPGDIRIRDNGAVPQRIVAFDELQDRPLRLGVLLDTSESMYGALPASKTIAESFVQKAFRQRGDAGFVSTFGNEALIVKSWSDDKAQVVDGIRLAGQKRKGQSGTALFNAVFQACASSFAKADPSATGNLILLFSDGEDNTGLTSIEDATRACQRSNTEIFAFLYETRDRPSTGPKALRDLAAKTGGRVYPTGLSPDTLSSELNEIESLMRNQYRLVYSPPGLRRDGTFHEIELQPPDGVSRILVRSGYFAPRQ